MERLLFQSSSTATVGSVAMARRRSAELAGRRTLFCIPTWYLVGMCTHADVCMHVAHASARVGARMCGCVHAAPWLHAHQQGIHHNGLQPAGRSRVHEAVVDSNYMGFYAPYPQSWTKVTSTVPCRCGSDHPRLSLGPRKAICGCLRKFLGTLCTVHALCTPPACSSPCLSLVHVHPPGARRAPGCCHLRNIQNIATGPWAPAGALGPPDTPDHGSFL